jgi:glycosyltransferase involved in cell wall biosynthesis
MRQEMPEVSVIINCNNGEKYLREAIDSVYDQTFEDWEIVFWDNQSKDRSAEIAKSYDSKLQYFKSVEFTTLGAARKNALSKCKGEWIAFLDCDDYWRSEKLAIQIDAINSGNYVLCYGGVEEILSNGRKLRDVLPEHETGYIFDKLLLQFDINMVTPLIRHKTLLKYNLTFDEVIKASEEYNLFMRLAAKGKISVIDKILGTYRVLNNSLTDKEISSWAHERRYTLGQVARENPGIDVLYSPAFQEAYARADYYEARLLMKNGDIYGARKKLHGIANKSNKYKILYYISFIPVIWKTIHSTMVKRSRLITTFLKYFK